MLCLFGFFGSNPLEHMASSLESAVAAARMFEDPSPPQSDQKCITRGMCLNPASLDLVRQQDQNALAHHSTQLECERQRDRKRKRGREREARTSLALAAPKASQLWQAHSQALMPRRSWTHPDKQMLSSELRTPEKKRREQILDWKSTLLR